MDLFSVRSGECVRVYDSLSLFDSEHEWSQYLHRNMKQAVFSQDGDFIVTFCTNIDSDLVTLPNRETIAVWNSPRREIYLQVRERMYALLSALKHNESAPHRSMYRCGKGPLTKIMEMVAWWDTEWIL